MRLARSKFFRGFFYLVFLGACIEVALQGFYYASAGDFLFRRHALPIFAREPYAGYGNRAGFAYEHKTNEFHAHYYINQAGFRVPRPDREFAYAKSAHSYRIMLLGPSFAFGWGVDHELSFAGVLKRLLQERGFAENMRIEIINAGVPSMLVAPQLAWFERIGKRYAPDLVIQFIYGSVMIPDVAQPFVAVDDTGYLVRTNVDASLRWRERLKKFATVFYGWMLWTELDRIFSLPSDGERSSAVLGAGREIAPSMQFDPTNPYVRESMRVYSRLDSAVRADGAQLLVVFFPLSYAIHKEDESRWRHLGVVDIARQSAFNAAFLHYLNERRIPSIDITEALRKSAETGDRIYFWLDIHWTAAGNAAAAGAVADRLGTIQR